MKSFCNGFDRYVRGFYPFASSQLLELNGVEPPVTRVLVIQDNEQWKRTLCFLQKLSGIEEDFAKYRRASPPKVFNLQRNPPRLATVF